MTRRGAGAIAHPQEEPELHDDIKGGGDDNHFYGGCFFGAGLPGECQMALSNHVRFLIRELCCQPGRKRFDALEFIVKNLENFIQARHLQQHCYVFAQIYQFQLAIDLG